MNYDKSPLAEGSSPAGPGFIGCNPIQAVRPRAVEGSLGQFDGAKTVMVVDDEDGVRKIASIALRRCGYAVIEAANGDIAAEILAAADTPKIDLLLSDVRMTGGIDGHRLAQLFLAKHPETPVLLMSGGGSNDERKDLRLSYIPKPFTVRSLPADVRQAIESAALHLC